MKALKALVIFLGVLIVLGLGILAYGITVRLGKITTAGAPASVSSANVAVQEAGGNPNLPGYTAFGDVDIPLPDGARVLSIWQSGPLLLARFAQTGGAEGIAVFDLARGQALGTVRFTVTGVITP